MRYEVASAMLDCCSAWLNKATCSGKVVDLKPFLDVVRLPKSGLAAVHNSNTFLRLASTSLQACTMSFTHAKHIAEHLRGQ